MALDSEWLSVFSRYVARDQTVTSCISQVGLRPFRGSEKRLSDLMLDFLLGARLIVLVETRVDLIMTP